MKIIKNLKFDKLSVDTFYSLMSNFIIGISGALLNLIIGKWLGFTVLGVFNQCFSLYFLLSLFCLLGFRNSILKFSSEKSTNHNELLSSCLLFVGLFSLIVCSLIFWVLKFELISFINSDVQSAFCVFVVGVPFLSINKVLLGYLNGVRNIKLFSNLQSLKFIVIFIMVVLIIFLKFKVKYIYYIVSFAEIMVTICAFLWLKKFRFTTKKLFFYAKKNFFFGIKSFFLEFIGEASLYIDIFIISFFLSNSDVGKYSVAITIINGLMIFSSSVQINFNPIASKLWSRSKKKLLEKLIRIITKKMWIVNVIGFLLAGLLFPIYLGFINSYSIEILLVFYTLLILFLVPAVYYFSGAIFSMADFINFHMKITFFTFICNIVFSYFLVGKFGLMGAAVSTGIYHLISVLCLVYGVRKKMNLSFHKKKVKHMKLY